MPAAQINSYKDFCYQDHYQLRITCHITIINIVIIILTIIIEDHQYLNLRQNQHLTIHYLANILVPNCCSSLLRRSYLSAILYG